MPLSNNFVYNSLIPQTVQIGYNLYKEQKSADINKKGPLISETMKSFQLLESQKYIAQ